MRRKHEIKTIKSSTKTVPFADKPVRCINLLKTNNTNISNFNNNYVQKSKKQYQENNKPEWSTNFKRKLHY